MVAHAAPQAFLAYAPEGPGLRCAMFYFAAGDDLWGWFTGPRGPLLVADYFRVAGFHALREPRYSAVDIAGLGAWSDEPSMCRELSRLQSEFAREWLFYRSAREAPVELAHYHARGFATGEVNVRFPRLHRLARMQADWTYCSSGFESAVLRWLAYRWPLDYRPESVTVKALDGLAVTPG